MSNSGWESILDNGEEILWQGRPDGKVHVNMVNLLPLCVGLAVAGHALYPIVLGMPVVGTIKSALPQVIMGLAVGLGALFVDAYIRRSSWYTLTNRRAIITSKMLLKGRELKSYPINATTVLDYKQGALATIHFAEEEKRNAQRHTIVTKIGFLRILDGEKVYRMMREIQAGKSHE